MKGKVHPTKTEERFVSISQAAMYNPSPLPLSPPLPFPSLTMFGSAGEVAYPAIRAVVLPYLLLQFHTDPLPWSKLRGPSIAHYTTLGGLLKLKLAPLCMLLLIIAIMIYNCRHFFVKSFEEVLDKYACTHVHV